LELFLAKQGKPFKIITDIGSGINYQKQGLREIIKMIVLNQIDTIYILYKARLVRFGFELIEEFARLHNTRLEVINQTEDKTDEEELVEDILNIIYMFSCRLNSKKSHINRKIAKKLLNEKA
jgi:putative resolvase